MLSTDEIRKIINEDLASEKKKKAAEGQRYYEAEHDILKCRLFYYNADGELVEDKMRANIKISHPFFRELSDQLAYHILSFKQNPIRAKDNVEGLQVFLDDYFGAKFWAEIGDLITDAYNMGFGYLYGYKNAEDKLVFECADSMGVAEVREQDTDDKCKYLVYHYIDRIDKGKKVIRRIQVWNDKEIHYFVQSGANGKVEKDKAVPINPRPHVVYTEDETEKQSGAPLGYIPFWRLDNNKKQHSGLKPIKGLIDDYDLHACSLSNNLKDFDTPLHVVSGYQGDNLDELQTNLKTKKIIGVDADGDVQVRTVDIPYQARKEKLDIDERNIYKFGMGFNSSQVGDGNITNVVIQSRYTLLEMKAKKMQDRLCALLEEIIKVVLDEINAANNKDFKFSDIEFDFKRDTITNETENIANEKVKAETKQLEVNTVLNAAEVIGNEEVLRLICEQLDVDFDEVKGQVEAAQQEQQAQTPAAAKSILNGVVPDDEKDGISNIEPNNLEA